MPASEHRITRADIVAPQERARYMGYFMATFATSSVLGPPLTAR